MQKTQKCRYLREKCVVDDVKNCPKTRMKGIATTKCGKIPVTNQNKNE